MKLGVWRRIGIVATVLWLICYSVIGYIDLSRGKAEQIRVAHDVCKGDEQSCLSGWVSMSEAALAGVSVGIAALVALVFWALVGAGYLTVKWVLAGRHSN